MLKTKPTLFIPKIVIYLLTAICALPFILNLLGIDFGVENTLASFQNTLKTENTNLLISQLHLSLAGSFLHTIFEWTAVGTAISTGVLALIYYKARNDLIAPIVGIALFFSGCLDCFHIMTADYLIPTAGDSENLIPFTWLMSRLFNSVILIIGVTLLLLANHFSPLSKKIDLRFAAAIAFVFTCIAYPLIHYCIVSKDLPKMIFPEQLISSPYDLIPFFLYLFAGIFLFPSLFKKSPSFFSHALIISSIPQCATQLYVIMGSTMLFDNNFNIAHALKIIAYLVPFLGLATDYIHSYQEQVKSQVILQETFKELQSLSNKASAQLESYIQSISSHISKITNNTRAMSTDTNKTAKMTTATLDESEATESVVIDLHHNSEEIEDIIEVISSIANQTKLLALNASLEASRAGESGKGFAVVAEEVKLLSNQTSQSVQMVNSKINKIQTSLEEALGNISKTTASIRSVHEISQSTADSLEQQKVANDQIASSVAKANLDLKKLSLEISNLSKSFREQVNS